MEEKKVVNEIILQIYPNLKELKLPFQWMVRNRNFAKAYHHISLVTEKLFRISGGKKEKN
jgi:hypothetical protein